MNDAKPLGRRKTASGLRNITTQAVANAAHTAIFALKCRHTQPGDIQICFARRTHGSPNNQYTASPPHNGQRLTSGRHQPGRHRTHTATRATHTRGALDNLCTHTTGSVSARTNGDVVLAFRRGLPHLKSRLDQTTKLGVTALTQ